MTNKKVPKGLRSELIFGAALAASIGISSIANPAMAEENNNDVVVKVNKNKDHPYTDSKAPYRTVKSASPLLTEKLQDTPKTVTVLSSEQIKDLGVKNTKDVFRTQSGITLGTGEGGNAYGDRIFIRGFDARNDVYIDGARDPGLASRETFATEQIEILKGPSGAFGGRGTTGGLVSIVSKKPTGKDSTEVQATVGTNNTSRFTIDANRKINDDLSVRLNLMEHKENIAGRDHVYNNRWGTAFAADYHPNDQLKLAFDYYHLSTDYMPDWGIPWNPNTSSPLAGASSNFYGLANRDYGKTYSDIYTLNGSYKFRDNLKYTSLIRAGQVDNEYIATAPEGANYTTGTVNANAKQRFQLTNYIDFQNFLNWDFNTGTIKHSFVTGFELSKENTKMKNYSFVECGTPPCSGTVKAVQSLYNPNFYLPWTVASETPTGHTKIETETKAIYAIDTLHFGDKWLLTLGGRADNYKTHRSSLTYATNVAGATVDSDSNFISYQTGLVYKPKQNISLYTSYASSANPPCEVLDSTGVDYGGCSTTTSTADPIENKSLEAGIKLNINRHLDVTAAAFNVNRKKVPSVVSNVLYLDEQEVKGVEFGANGNVTDRLSVAAGVTLLDTKTTKSTNPNSTNVGKAFPNVAQNSLTLTGKYKVTDKLALGGTLISQSRKYGGTTSANTNYLKGFTRVDLFGEYKLNDKVELDLNILNVGDVTYYDSLYRSSSPYVYVAPGRSATFTVEWKF